MIVRAVLFLSLLLAVPLRAQAEDLAIVGGEIHPVSGAVIGVGTVIIRGERILAVGRDVAVPAGAKVIDAKGKVVTPGLFESATQLGLVEIDLEKSTVDANPVTPDPIRSGLRAEEAIDLRSLLFGVARRQGVTTAISAPSGGLLSGQAALIDLVGEHSRAFSTAVKGGVAQTVQLGIAGATAVDLSRAAAVLRLREVLDDARAYQKNKAGFAKNQLYTLSASRLDLEALGPVLLGQQILIVNVSRAADITTVLELAKRERLKIALLGAEEAWLVADQIAAAKVPVIVNPLANLPASFEARASRSDNAALLARAGVKVAISTMANHNAGGLRFVLGNAVRAGLPKELALKAGTLVPAEIYGVSPRYGSLEPGKLANVVVWSGDPFEPKSYASEVIIRGEVQPTESRQTRLAKKHLSRLGLVR